jgi:hypothetical protein
MAENEEKAAAPAKKAAAKKTPEYEVTKKGVLITDANGEDVYVQPESVKVWLDRGAKLKK